MTWTATVAMICDCLNFGSRGREGGVGRSVGVLFFDRGRDWGGDVGCFGVSKERGGGRVCARVCARVWKQQAEEI